LVRTRALTAVGLLPTRGTRDFLTVFVKQHAADEGAPDKLLLRKAALSLGWVGGTAVADVLAPLLEHADADVRLDAAIALGLTRSRDAADWLRQRFDVEKDQRVRTQIGRQLRLLEQAEASAPAAASDTK
jgi:HEAT repeat protein